MTYPDPLEAAFLRLRHAADTDEYVPTEQVIDTVLFRLAAAREALTDIARGDYSDPFCSRVIPIATICNPPEPTVIDESDLAPGMVVVAVDDVTGHAMITTPDVRLGDDGYAWAFRLSQIWFNDVESVQHIAGPRRP